MVRWDGAKSLHTHPRGTKFSRSEAPRGSKGWDPLQSYQAMKR